MCNDPGISPGALTGGVWILNKNLFHTSLPGAGSCALKKRTEETTTVENVDYRPDRAVVTVSDEIDTQKMLALAALMQRLHHEYFYKRIELEISSPGGLVMALDYLVEVMDQLRSKGVSFTTRALMSVSSAAANLVSLGNRRETLRSSSFLYHQARAAGLDKLTAQSAASILTEVGKIDERYLARLAQQARRNSYGAGQLGIDEFQDGDWTALTMLLTTAGVSQAKIDGRRGRKKVLRRLRRHVSACLKDKDDMMRLYRRLLELDRPISAALALELRLVDNFVDDSVRAPAQGACLTVPEWHPLFPAGQVSRTTLCRHTLILGESGAGKTVSGILPVVGAVMAPDSPVGCALIIDPKSEIRAHVQRNDNVYDLNVHRGDRRPVVNVMAGDGLDVTPALDDGQYLTAARKMLIRAASLAPASAASTLAGVESDPHARYWDNEGARLAMTALGLALLILRNRQTVYKQSLTCGRNETADARRALLEFARRAGLIEALEPYEEVSACLERSMDEISNLKYPKFRHKYDAEHHRRVTFLGAPDEFDQALWDEVSEPAEKEHEESLMMLLRRFINTARLTAIYQRDPEFAEKAERFYTKFTTVTHDEQLMTEELFFLHPDPPQLAEDKILPSPNVLALAGEVLQSWFNFAVNSEDKSNANTKASNPKRRMIVSGVVDLLKESITGGQATEIYRQIEDVWAPMAALDNPCTFAGIAGHARTCFWDFSDETPANTLYFGVEPYYRSVLTHGRDDLVPVDFTAAVNDETTRAVYVFQPRLDGNEALVARALKAAYFEAVLSSRKRAERGATMPLAAYIADEFHRFITSDKVHGEQSFFDTCRSFGAFCVVACQSVSNMEHALAAAGAGNWVKNRAAVSILLNNTANKLCFRSTDQSLRARLDDLCPRTGSGRVTEVRPPSTLQTGECYASLADGRFERQQLRPFGDGQESAGEERRVLA